MSTAAVSVISSPLRKCRQHVESYRMPCRWLQKRMRRYSHIICDFCDATMLERSEDAGEGSASCAVPPLLPSLLAACAPSAELKLYVAPGQGKPTNDDHIAAQDILLPKDRAT